MALYTKPVNSPRIAGSRKGATFTRTPNGFIIRRRYMPKTSRNERTTRNRIKFLASVQHYRSLSPTGKASFQNQAPNFQRTNSLGEPYTLSPIQLATSQTFNMLEIENTKPVLATPPVIFTPFTLGGAGWTLQPPALVMSVSPDPVPLDVDVIIWLSPSGDFTLSAIPVSQMRQVLTVPGGHTSIIDLLPAYRDTFGQERWSIGQSMVIGLQSYKHGTGQKSSINYSLIGLAS